MTDPNDPVLPSDEFNVAPEEVEAAHLQDEEDLRKMGSGRRKKRPSKNMNKQKGGKGAKGAKSSKSSKNDKKGRKKDKRDDSDDEESGGKNGNNSNNGKSGKSSKKSRKKDKKNETDSDENADNNGKNRKNKLTAMEPKKIEKTKKIFAKLAEIEKEKQGQKMKHLDNDDVAEVAKLLGVANLDRAKASKAITKALKVMKKSSLGSKTFAKSWEPAVGKHLQEDIFKGKRAPFALFEEYFDDVPYINKMRSRWSKEYTAHYRLDVAAHNTPINKPEAKSLIEAIESETQISPLQWAWEVFNQVQPNKPVLLELDGETIRFTLPPKYFDAIKIIGAEQGTVDAREMKIPVTFPMGGRWTKADAWNESEREWRMILGACPQVSKTSLDRHMEKWKLDFMSRVCYFIFVFLFLYFWFFFIFIFLFLYFYFYIFIFLFLFFLFLFLVFLFLYFCIIYIFIFIFYFVLFKFLFLFLFIMKILILLFMFFVFLIQAELSLKGVKYLQPPSDSVQIPNLLDSNNSNNSSNNNNNNNNSNNNNLLPTFTSPLPVLPHTHNVLSPTMPNIASTSQVSQTSQQVHPLRVQRVQQVPPLPVGRAQQVPPLPPMPVVQMPPMPAVPQHSQQMQQSQQPQQMQQSQHLPDMAVVQPQSQHLQQSQQLSSLDQFKYQPKQQAEQPSQEWLDDYNRTKAKLKQMEQQEAQRMGQVPDLVEPNGPPQGLRMQELNPEPRVEWKVTQHVSDRMDLDVSPGVLGKRGRSMPAKTGLKYCLNKEYEKWILPKEELTEDEQYAEPPSSRRKLGSQQKGSTFIRRDYTKWRRPNLGLDTA